jgi:hypothetical protein
MPAAYELIFAPFLFREFGFAASASLQTGS